MGSLAFVTPLALAALILLPALWWILRTLPPRPRRVMFPPLALLLAIMPAAPEPKSMPLWLLLVRVALAACFILAMAGPRLDQSTPRLAGKGPVLLIIGTGWSAAPDWQTRITAAKALVDEAEQADRPIALLATGSRTDEITLQTPAELRARLTSLTPVTFIPALGIHKKAIDAFFSRFTDTEAVLIAEPLASPADQDVQATLTHPFLVLSGDDQRLALAGARHDADGLTLRVVRNKDGQEQSGRVTGFDSQGHLVGDALFQFTSAAVETEAHIKLPTMLLNDITRLVIEGASSAGGVWLMGADGQRRRVGLVSQSQRDKTEALNDPAWYVSKALEPFADLITPPLGLSESIDSLIATKADMIILVDGGALIPQAREALQDYVAKGGVLIRFAGPQAPKDDDTLWPVKLRPGNRSLGGAMDWETPRHLAPFSDTSPFAGIDVPDEVTIKRQWLAEPDADLASRSWAQLDDGTPLVTGMTIGRGRLILFHVTPDATWSSLPLSGLFVNLLQRITMLAGRHDESTLSHPDQAVAPFQTLDGFGIARTPDIDAQPLRPALILQADYAHPAGFYGTRDAPYALNALKPGDRLTRAEWTANATQRLAPLSATPPISLTPWLMLVALLLFVLDTLATLHTRGGLTAPPRRARMGAFLLILGLMAVHIDPAHAVEKPLAPKDADSTLETHLAYVITGDARLDRISAEGLQGLSDFLAEHTALEPGQPVGVDLSYDALDVYPFLYWPVSDATATLPASVFARVDTYMRNGGLIVFDTQDEAFKRDDQPTPEVRALRRILSNLTVPELEPVPSDHVVMRAFYLLKAIPGRYAEGKTWIEALPKEEQVTEAPARGGDSVSPLVISSNDLASAWAMDRTGKALYPIDASMPRQRDMALRAGVNLVMYALTGNYKADQVHVPSLLERLRR